MGESSVRSSILVFLLLIGLGLLVYAPWTPQPFNVLDFSEFLPLLRASDSPLDAFANIVAYYRGHGRSNLIQSSFIVLNWELFGENPVGWRFLRVLAMALPIAAVLLLLRRLARSTAAVAFGTFFLVCSGVAAGNWVRLTGEPFGLLFLSLALCIALDFRESDAWRPAVVQLTVLVGLMLMSKETLVVCVPAILAVALCTAGPGRVIRPRNDLRTRALLGSVTAVTAFFIAAAWWVARTSGSEAYVATYGSADISLSDLARNAAAIALPLGGWSVTAPSVAYAAVVVLGTAAALRKAPRSAWAPVALSAFLILAGAVVYLPWGRFELFYGLPFALGSVILLSGAVDGFSGVAGRSRPLIWAVVGVLLLFSAAVAQHDAARIAASRRIDWSFVEDLPEWAVDSLFVAVENLPAQPWQGAAATYARMASVVDRVPIVSGSADKLCRQARALVPATPYSRAVFTYDGRCPFTAYDRSYVERYEYLKIPGLAFGHGQVRAGVIVRGRSGPQ